MSTSPEVVHGFAGRRYGLFADSIHMPWSLRKLRIMDTERDVQVAEAWLDGQETVDSMARLARTLNDGTGPRKERALQECGR